MPQGTPAGRLRLDEARSIPFSGRNQSVVQKSWTLSSLVNYVFLWQLVFPIQPTPDASLYVSWKGKKLGNFSLLNGGCLKLAEMRFSPHLYVAQIGLSAEKRRRPSEVQLCQFLFLITPAVSFAKNIVFCKPDCWCDEKKELAMVTQQELTLIQLCQFSKGKSLFPFTLTLCEATARSTILRKMQSYKSVFYQKKEALLFTTTLPCLKVFVSLITKNKSKSSWDTEKFAKSGLKEKSSGRMRTKRQNRKECCFLRCFSSSPGHWQTSKLSQEGRVLSDRKIDLQTTLSSRSQLESSAGKPFTSSSAN